MGVLFIGQFFHEYSNFEDSVRIHAVISYIYADIIEEIFFRVIFHKYFEIRYFEIIFKSLKL